MQNHRGQWSRWLTTLGLVVGASSCTDDSLSTAQPWQVEPSFDHDGATQLGAGTDVRAPGTYIINGARWTAQYPFNVGTGLINPFLSVQAAGEESGFNTDANDLPLNTTRPSFTNKLPLNKVPIMIEAGSTWREFILDANEANSAPDANFSIDHFDLYLCTGAPSPATYTLAEFNAAKVDPAKCTPVYSLGAAASLRATDGNTQGSGNALDYRILVPASGFPNAAHTACPYNPDGADCPYYIVLYAHMGGLGGDFVTGSTFEEFSTIQRPVPGSLTIVKRVVNDHGGTATVGSFGITSSAGALTFGSGVADGASTLKYTSNTMFLLAGSYTLVESNVSGYSEGSWACTGAAGAVVPTFGAGSVTIADGQVVVCTITNNDDAGSLQIVKRVVNDNGGTATVSAFGISTSAGGLTFGSGVTVGSTTTYTSQVINVSAGPYTLRENDVPGYTEGTWSCTGATASPTSITGGSVTVPNGVAVVCTITNDDTAPSQGSLQIVKRVVNDNGGTATVGAFGLSSSAGALSFGPGVTVGSTTTYTSQAINVNAGPYTLRENDISGYSEGTWSCTGAAPSNNTITAGSVAVPNGVTVVCTITNDDAPAPSASLQIVKRVTNDNGGTATVGAFGLSTSAGALSFDTGVTVGSTTTYTSQVINVAPGPYTLRELDVGGYTEGTWSCTGATPSNNTISDGLVTVPAAGQVVCSISNNDTPGTPSGPFTTRTQGFWSTHRSITTAAWFGGTVGDNTFSGVSDKSLCEGTQARELDTIGKVLGGFWSNIPKTSTGTKRSDLDKARMQLAQQLLAAILNNAAFGSSPSGPISIAQARDAYCGTDIDAVQAAQAAMAEFNESGDSGSFTPGDSANGKDAKGSADIPFWDSLP